MERRRGGNLHDERQTKEPDHGPPSCRGQGETILLVDDEIGVLEIGKLVLGGLNYKVVTAIDGADGLVKLVEHKEEIRVIITDMHMPHMDGLAFVRALRRVLPEIPVIMGSGRLDDAVAEELKLLGVRDRLDKPYTQHKLAAMLAKLLAGAKTSGVPNNVTRERPWTIRPSLSARPMARGFFEVAHRDGAQISLPHC